MLIFWCKPNSNVNLPGKTGVAGGDPIGIYLWSVEEMQVNLALWEIYRSKMLFKV